MQMTIYCNVLNGLLIVISARCQNWLLVFIQVITLKRFWLKSTYLMIVKIRRINTTKKVSVHNCSNHSLAKDTKNSKLVSSKMRENIFSISLKSYKRPKKHKMDHTIQLKHLNFNLSNDCNVLSATT